MIDLFSHFLWFVFQDYRDYGLSKKPIQLRTEVLTIDNLKIGQTLEGTVKNVTHFGAFVDIGIGKDALLHQSELRYNGLKLFLNEQIYCFFN